MKKPEVLGRLLLAAVPGLAASPERLQMFIDKGRVASRATGTLGFEVRYTLNIVLQDFAGDTTDVFVPLLSWIAEHQPALLEASGNEPFHFEAEVLDGDAVDLSIDIELSESVGVTPKPGGGFTAEHFPEPPRFESFGGVDDTVTLWQLSLGSEAVVQSAQAPPSE
ncbi:MAG TPA: phage tail protein [Allosphingosinicella sp.]|jgi:hypothetical protein